MTKQRQGENVWTKVQNQYRRSVLTLVTCRLYFPTRPFKRWRMLPAIADWIISPSVGVGFRLRFSVNNISEDAKGRPSHKDAWEETAECFSNSKVTTETVVDIGPVMSSHRLSNSVKSSSKSISHSSVRY